MIAAKFGAMLAVMYIEVIVFPGMGSKPMLPTKTMQLGILAWRFDGGA